ncbi:hypothetical protein LCGC14_1411940 [marine sediment metagenome]|uniref:Uncharacterized protein n=1 Tax=marine sediment metagenome TaxID=412755 RepID=A0A0F9KF32_9ZZZZ
MALSASESKDLKTLAEAAKDIALTLRIIKDLLLLKKAGNGSKDTDS